MTKELKKIENKYKQTRWSWVNEWEAMTALRDQESENPVGTIIKVEDYPENPSTYADVFETIIKDEPSLSGRLLEEVNGIQGGGLITLSEYIASSINGQNSIIEEWRDMQIGDDTEPHRYPYLQPSMRPSEEEDFVLQNTTEVYVGQAEGDGTRPVYEAEPFNNAPFAEQTNAEQHEQVKANNSKLL